MKPLGILSLTVLSFSPAFAAELATGEQITAAISGNTVQGGMSDGAAYTEFYDASGDIKANGYSGTWYVESELMCFEYGEGPTCFSVGIDGNQVTWMQDGAEAGTGTIVVGNPNGF